MVVVSVVLVLGVILAAVVMMAGDVSVVAAAVAVVFSGLGFWLNLMSGPI